MNFWALGRILPDVVRTCAPMLALHVPARLLNGTGFWLKDAGVWREIHAVLSCLKGNAFVFASKDIHLCAKLAQEGCGSPLSHPLLLSRVAFTSHGASVAKVVRDFKICWVWGCLMALKKKTTRAKPGRILNLWQLEDHLSRWWGSRSFVSRWSCWAPLTARFFFSSPALWIIISKKSPRCVHMSMECRF